MATLVERTTRFTMLLQLDARDTATVTARVSAQMLQLPAQLRKSLTWDRGMELAAHKSVTAATGLAVYFAAPRAHGSAAPTRTPTASCDSTYPREPAWVTSPRPPWTPSPCS